jgi:hypothetical protein
MSARIFELLARSLWLGFLGGALLAEVAVYGWAGIAAGTWIEPSLAEAQTAALALGAALFEWSVPMAFCRRREPFASLAGAVRDMAVPCFWLAAAGAVPSITMRLNGDGAQVLLAPIGLGLGASVALWLLTTAYAWSARRVDEQRRLEEVRHVTGGSPLAVGALYATARRCNTMTKALLWTIYFPIAYPSMLAARLARMLREPLYYRCRLGGCTFRSADPAIRVNTPRARRAHGLEAVQTWPTLNRPLFVRSPRDGSAQLVPTWHGLDRLERAGHLRHENADCRGLCRGAYARRILVLAESGPELAMVQAELHAAVSERMETLSASARAYNAAINQAVADGRWGVANRSATSFQIEGCISELEAEARGQAAELRPTESAGRHITIDIDVVSDFEQRVWAPAYCAIVVLPMRASEGPADLPTYIASRLAQIRARWPLTSAARAGYRAPSPPRAWYNCARPLLQRIFEFGSSQAAGNDTGRAPGSIVVFLPRQRAAEYTKLQAPGVPIIEETDKLRKFIQKVLQ